MDNYGVTWVLQHIVPRDWAEEPDDAYLLNYYKNNSIINTNLIY